MFQSPVVLWTVLTVGFLVLEGVTVALVSVWFASGAAAALVLALLGAPLWAQVLVFLAVSGALLAMLRPIIRKNGNATKTNVDGVIGSQGLVTADIDNIRYTGEVKLGAMTWTARSTSGEPIPSGAKIRVDRIEGVKVYVSKAE